jgi:hypothetical protein
MKNGERIIIPKNEVTISNNLFKDLPKFNCDLISFGIYNKSYIMIAKLPEEISLPDKYNSVPLMHKSDLFPPS